MKNANRWGEKRRAASVVGRKRAKARWAGERDKEPDADTLRWRSLQDAKGIVMRQGVTFRGDGRLVPWAVRRSLAGRTDQLDVVAHGKVVTRLGRTRLRKLLPGALPGLAFTGGES